MGRYGLVLVGALLGAAVAVAVTIAVLGDDEEVPDSARPAPTTTSLAPSDAACQSARGEARVRIHFGDQNADEDMLKAADALRDDDRVAQLVTETRSEAYQRFKVIFKDQPHLVELVRPETLPASVELKPADGISTTELTEDLEGKFTGADDIQAWACPA